MSDGVTFRESDIRPDHLKREQQKRFAADVRWLLQQRDQFVRVACPACDQRESRLALEKCSLTYVECVTCGTLYMNPRPTPAVLEKYYARSENYTYWNTCVFPASEDVRREKIFRPRAERLIEICERYGVATGVLCEVGAGFGTFCEEIRGLGRFRRIIAIEPTPDLAATCRKRGLEVIEEPIEQVCMAQQGVDVLVSFEVIEHLFSPRSFVTTCASLLVPGGLAVVTCPNVRGFDLLVLQAESDTVDAEHLNYFHPQSLSRLFLGCGFEVLETLTPGRLDAELVRKQILAGTLSGPTVSFLRHVLVDEWERLGAAFQQFLVDHGLSSHMWLLARKRP